MPYRFAQTPLALRVDLLGVISAADIRGMLEEVERIEAGLSVMPNRVIDLTQVTAHEFTTSDMIANAHRRRMTAFSNPFRVAIIAPTPVSLGYARMFQILNDNADVTIEIFNDDGGAAAWLSAGTQHAD
ncbi:MAG TPA: hypothetical protein VN700_19265 [Vicinamibacterales bacterium]|nr:hypothetical protein [Vicinamibacterales bacterium]